MKTTVMKKLVLFIIIQALIFLSVTVVLIATGHTQIASHSSNPVIPVFQEHVQSANMHSLTSDGGTSAASGGSNDNIPKQHQPEESLGDAARRLRAQRDGQPKAKKVYVNQ